MLSVGLHQIEIDVVNAVGIGHRHRSFVERQRLRSLLVDDAVLRDAARSALYIGRVEIFVGRNLRTRTAVVAELESGLPLVVFEFDGVVDRPTRRIGFGIGLRDRREDDRIARLLGLGHTVDGDIERKRIPLGRRQFPLDDIVRFGRQAQFDAAGLDRILRRTANERRVSAQRAVVERVGAGRRSYR